jgi:hypothetical protein
MPRVIFFVTVPSGGGETSGVQSSPARRVGRFWPLPFASM